MQHESHSGQLTKLLLEGKRRVTEYSNCQLPVKCPGNTWVIRREIDAHYANQFIFLFILFIDRSSFSLLNQQLRSQAQSMKEIADKELW